MSDVMIFSLRPGGYMRGGVRYDRHPRVIQVVAELAESPASATARRQRGTLTDSELAEIRELIERAERAGQEPALTVVDAVAEASALNHKLLKKRAQVAAAAEQIRDQELKIAANEAERQAQEKLMEDAARAAAAVNDRLQSAQRQLEEAERKYGALNALEHKNSELKARIVVLEKAGE
jgi:chromosome segregation ATPase